MNWLSAIVSGVIRPVFEAFAKSAFRKCFRRAIRDLVEDEIDLALSEFEITKRSRNIYKTDNKYRLKQEIRNRIDPMLRN